MAFIAALKRCATQKHIARREALRDPKHGTAVSRCWKLCA